MTINNPNLRRQNGVVLVTSLIILTAVSMVTLFNLNNANVRQRISANIKNDAITFKNAENTLREAENSLSNISKQQPGFYDISTTNDPIQPYILNWRQNAFSSSQPDNFFVIEYMGCQRWAGTWLMQCDEQADGLAVYKYRITVNSEGIRGNHSILQAIYFSDKGPDTDKNTIYEIVFDKELSTINTTTLGDNDITQVVDNMTPLLIDPYASNLFGRQAWVEL